MTPGDRRRAQRMPRAGAAHQDSEATGQWAPHSPAGGGGSQALAGWAGLPGARVGAWGGGPQGCGAGQPEHSKEAGGDGDGAGSGAPAGSGGPGP